MKSLLGILLVSMLALVACTTTSAPPPVTTKTHTPAKGSAERASILAAAKAAMEKLDPTRKVVLTAPYLKVNGGWAWAQVNPKSPDGKSTYEPQSGLFHRVNGKWTLAAWLPSEEGTDPKAELAKIKKKYPQAAADIFPA